RAWDSRRDGRSPAVEAAPDHDGGDDGAPGVGTAPAGTGTANVTGTGTGALARSSYLGGKRWNEASQPSRGESQAVLGVDARAARSLGFWGARKSTQSAGSACPAVSAVSAVSASPAVSAVSVSVSPDEGRRRESLGSRQRPHHKVPLVLLLVVWGRDPSPPTPTPDP
ncbi:unnamed protein product, partial [Lampetra fluviatilis]